MAAVVTHGDNDGKVPGERTGHEGLGEPADVGVRSKMVALESLVAGGEGHGGRERDANHLHQVQVSP